MGYKRFRYFKRKFREIDVAKIKAWSDKMEELLEIDIIRDVANGVAMALAIMCAGATFVSGILALSVSGWWALSVILSGLLTGAFVGLARYFMDKY